MTVTRYTMMATAIKTRKTNGVLLRKIARFMANSRSYRLSENMFAVVTVVAVTVEPPVAYGMFQHVKSPRNV